MPLIDPLLASILVCPADKGDLTEDEARSRLVCVVCRRAYPVTEGIPIMLIDEAELPDDSPQDPNGS
ncbi:MAG: Trm112 family protein [Actinobacteria bacterium]|nr:Trm112 family protein [Acidimicrobiia bacterium]MCA1735080.1 Trm112 family protein [Actinomycetota bacterium]MDQ3501994.1 Trm112 family protein [Actinomycetota bacterium]